MMRLMGGLDGHRGDNRGRSAVPATRTLYPSLLLLVCLAGLIALSGCTRRFFRNRADMEVGEVLHEKNVDPTWKLDDFNVYPNPIARYTDWTNPDRPPMPPDDPAAWFLSPKPQHPKEIAWLEGDGYVELLRGWDAENRTRMKAEEKQGESASPRRERKLLDKPPADKPAAPEPVSDQPPRALANGLPPSDCLDSLNYIGDRKEPFLINLEQSIELAVINSREFQARREDLYLAALPVTLERFAFAPQFEATNTTIREWAARESSVGRQNRWRSNTNLGVSKLFTTGALLTASLANRTVVNLTGNQKHTLSDSTLVLDLVQPLLRGGGRAVNLEPLTQAERDLLYEIRDWARFHKEFFVSIAAGGGQLGGGGGDFGGITLTVRGQAAQVGFYPTLLRQTQLVNELDNQRALTELFTRYQAYSDSNVVSPLQVGQVEQSLRSAQTTVNRADVQYQDGLDQFKIQLGLPTELPLTLEEPQGLQTLREKLDGYENVILGYRRSIFEIDQLGIQDSLGQRPLEPKELRQAIERILSTSTLLRGTPLQKRIQDAWNEWKALHDKDRKAFEQRLKDQRGRQNKLMQERNASIQKEQPFPPEKAQELADVTLNVEIAELELALQLHESRPWEKEQEPERRRRVRAERFSDVRNRFSLILTDAEVQEYQRVRAIPWPELPKILVNGVDLLAAEDQAPEDALLTPGQQLAGQTALANRLDLMNRRAEVADSWRKIKVFANSLMGVFDVRYNMEVLTPPPLTASQPLNFDGKRARHQIILNTELPLVRKLERNNYRSSLIAYQRQRRNLMAAEDQVLFQVRQNVRELGRLKREYEVQQRQAELAYTQVDNSEEKLVEPPAPGGAFDAATAAATNTQQLLNGLRSVPQAKNGLFSAYVNYLTARMELYRDLELMQVDSRGVWIDEYATDGQAARSDQPPCWP